MYFEPDYQLQILDEATFPSSILELEQKINACKTTGTFKAFDNITIYYEYFLTNKSRANIVIVHGLSEFTQKFYEFIYYLLNQGYNVFIHDQRCHGYSDRLTNEMDLLHVDKFTDYVLDLEYFIDNIVIPASTLPLYIYSQSMGGAIATEYLSRPQNRGKVEKAVLAVPLFQPIVKQVSVPVAQASAMIGRILVGPKKKFFISREFDPNVAYKPEPGSSKVRFERHIGLRRANERYRSTPMSFGWVHGSLQISSKLLKKKVLDNIQTPILLLSAQNDTMVQNSKQHIFAQLCSTCQFVEIENVGHALLAADNNTLSKVIPMILTFYDSRC